MAWGNEYRQKVDNLIVAVQELQKKKEPKENVVKLVESKLKEFEDDFTGKLDEAKKELTQQLEGIVDNRLQPIKDAQEVDLDELIDQKVKEAVLNLEPLNLEQVVTEKVDKVLSQRDAPAPPKTAKKTAKK